LFRKSTQEILLIKGTKRKGLKGVISIIIHKASEIKGGNFRTYQEKKFPVNKMHVVLLIFIFCCTVGHQIAFAEY
jgi:hypothetical protein